MPAATRLALGDLAIDVDRRTVVMGIVNVSHDSPVAHSVFAPDAARAHELIETRAAMGKVVLKP